LVLDGDKWSASCLNNLCFTQWPEGWISPRTNLDITARGNLLLMGTEAHSHCPQLVTDQATRDGQNNENGTERYTFL